MVPVGDNRISMLMRSSHSIPGALTPGSAGLFPKHTPQGGPVAPPLGRTATLSFGGGFPTRSSPLFIRVV